MSQYDFLGPKEKKCAGFIAGRIKASGVEGEIELCDAITTTVGDLNNTKMNNKLMEEVVLERVKEMKNNPTYDEILQEVQTVQKFPYDDGTTYQIFFNSGKNISLSSEVLLQRIKFDAAYMAATSKVPIGDITSYRIFLARLISGTKIKVIEKEKEIDEVGEAVDAVLRFIEGATLVDMLEKTIASDNIFQDGQNLFIPSTTLKKIFERERLQCSMRKLRVAFDDCMASSSKKIRVGDRTIRFWVFDIIKLNLPLKMKIVREDLPTDEAKTDGAC